MTFYLGEVEPETVKNHEVKFNENTAPPKEFSNNKGKMQKQMSNKENNWHRSSDLKEQSVSSKGTFSWPLFANSHVGEQKTPKAANNQKNEEVKASDPPQNNEENK